jgi:hypothetical protein
MATPDPYAALGLRANPFTLERGDAVDDALWLDRGCSAPPAPAPRRLVQVLGSKGAGKTAHLRRWQAALPGPYRHVPLGPARWRPPPLARIAYWDEADRIPPPVLAAALWLAGRRGATIVAGTHRDLVGVARRAGLSVVTVTLPPLDAAALRAWAERRIAAVRLPGAPAGGLALDETTAEAIARAAEGSWRRAADRLHVWAARAASGSTPVPRPRTGGRSPRGRGPAGR